MGSNLPHGFHFVGAILVIALIRADHKDRPYIVLIVSNLLIKLGKKMEIPIQSSHLLRKDKAINSEKIRPVNTAIFPSNVGPAEVLLSAHV